MTICIWASIFMGCGVFYISSECNCIFVGFCRMTLADFSQKGTILNLRWSHRFLQTSDRC